MMMDFDRVVSVRKQRVQKTSGGRRGPWGQRCLDLTMLWLLRPWTVGYGSGRGWGLLGWRGLGWGKRDAIDDLMTSMSDARYAGTTTT
jgi:hypothetical protein